MTLSASLALRATMRIHDGEPYVLVSAACNLRPTGTSSVDMYLRGGVRKASETKVGAVVSISAQFASRAWDALIPSRRKEILRHLSWLKSDEAPSSPTTRCMRPTVQG